MIVLYDSTERDFVSLGLGVLSDVKSCKITEGLNEEYELEMEYPITGQHYKDILYRRIILAKPNIVDNPQPFRIYYISKPLNGMVTINAQHISYDASGETIRPFSSVVGLDTALIAIQEHNIFGDNSKFELYTDKLSSASMALLAPCSLRSLLAGQRGSLLDIYGGEYKFDKWEIHLNNRRGGNRGYQIKYGVNMTEMEHELSSEKVYTGIYPFYSSTNLEITTEEKPYYEEFYPIAGETQFSLRWLNRNPQSTEPYIYRTPNWPIKVKMDNDPANDLIVQYHYASDAEVQALKHSVYINPNAIYYSINWFQNITPVIGHVYNIVDANENPSELRNTYWMWNDTPDNQHYTQIDESMDGIYVDHTNDPEVPIPKAKKYVKEEKEKTYLIDLTCGIDAYINEGVEPFSSNWLKDNNNIVYEPINGQNYIIKTESEYLNKRYTWNSSTNLYVEDLSNGVYWLTSPDAEDQNILTLDLTSDFSEVPTVAQLRDRTKKYVSDNKIGQLKESTTVSFVRLSDSSEYDYLSQLENIELGDDVEIINEKLGVHTTLRVITTTFNPITNQYIEIELGEKGGSLVNNVVTSGDNVSTLSNDAEYTNPTKVSSLIAKSITADYIQAMNAAFTEAQISKLMSGEIVISGKIAGGEININEAFIVDQNGNTYIKNLSKIDAIDLNNGFFKNLFLTYMNATDGVTTTNIDFTNGISLEQEQKDISFQDMYYSNLIGQIIEKGYNRVTRKYEISLEFKLGNNTWKDPLNPSLGPIEYYVTDPDIQEPYGSDWLVGPDGKSFKPQYGYIYYVISPTVSPSNKGYYIWTGVEYRSIGSDPYIPQTPDSSTHPTPATDWTLKFYYTDRWKINHGVSVPIHLGPNEWSITKEVLTGWSVSNDTVEFVGKNYLNFSDGLSLNANFSPKDTNAYTLGANNKRWKEVYTEHYQVDATLQSILSRLNANFSPKDTKTYTLGANNKRWKEVYTENYEVDATLKSILTRLSALDGQNY